MSHQHQQQPNHKILRSAVLPQGTHLCPVCGNAFSLHADAVVTNCIRCNARVELIHSETDVTRRAQSDPIELMKRRAEEANANFAREGNRFKAGGLVAEEEKRDTRQTEDALCDKCACVRKCFTHALQIRGADEGQTIFYECSHCHNQWSLNS